MKGGGKRHERHWAQCKCAGWWIRRRYQIDLLSLSRPSSVSLLQPETLASLLLSPERPARLSLTPCNLTSLGCAALHMRLEDGSKEGLGEEKRYVGAGIRRKVCRHEEDQG